MALAELGPSWTDGVQVEERKLQEYYHRKNHGLLLRGAAQTLKHTLDPIPTTNATDGLVHLGDTLMLRHAGTGGLLQADVQDEVEVNDNSRRESVGMALSSGQLLVPCARNVFTVSRVSDDDGFGSDGCLHYGQVVRLGASPTLSERPMYLFATDGTQGEALEDGDSLMCLYPRAVAGAQWRVARAQAPAKGEADDDLVRLGAPIRLESVATSHALACDEKLRMTSYGNECRVFGQALPPGGPSGVEEVSRYAWSFVDSQWAEEVVAATRKVERGGFDVDEDDAANPHAAKYLAGLYIPKGWGSDPGELLQSNDKRGAHELALLEGEAGAPARKTLSRILPLIRRAGMHVPRRLRWMCVQADVSGAGVLPLRTFSGVLSWSGVRLRDDELMSLLEILAPKPDSELIDYRRFFALMAPPLGQVRGGVVRDAYAKLRANAPGQLVEVMHLQRAWDPQSHPEVHSGRMSVDEAREEFMRQWDVSHADALVSYEEFLDYYQDVSMAVECNEVFVELVRRGWGL